MTMSMTMSVPNIIHGYCISCLHSRRLTVTLIRQWNKMRQTAFSSFDNFSKTAAVFALLIFSLCIVALNLPRSTAIDALIHSAQKLEHHHK